MTPRTNKSLKKIILQKLVRISILIFLISMLFSIVSYGQRKNFDHKVRLILVKPKSMNINKIDRLDGVELKKVKFVSIEQSSGNTEYVCNKLKEMKNLKYCQIISSNAFNQDSILAVLKKLKHLGYLSIENADTISEQIGQLKSLRWLGFANGHISEIPIEIYSLNNLRLLNFGYIYGHLIHGNNISIIPTGISNLKKLRYFLIQDNPIEFIPDEFCGLKRLKVIKTHAMKEEISYPKCVKDKIEFKN